MDSDQIKLLVSQDIGRFGLRLVIGSIFIAHGISKFNPGFAGFLTSQGIPVELQIPIALAELIPGILLITGILTRLSGIMLSIIMLGAIFVIKGAASLIGEGGVELDLILLASILIIVGVGPGKIALIYVIKKIPRCLQ